VPVSQPIDLTEKLIRVTGSAVKESDTASLRVRETCKFSRQSPASGEGFLHSHGDKALSGSQFMKGYFLEVSFHLRYSILDTYKRSDEFPFFGRI
jgi:hypothetical protein